jgi:hypothetical protein
MREGCAVLEVAPFEFDGTVGSVSDEGHVFRSLKALVATTVELTAEMACLVVVEFGTITTCCANSATAGSRSPGCRHLPLRASCGWSLCAHAQVDYGSCGRLFQE